MVWIPAKQLFHISLNGQKMDRSIEEKDKSIMRVHETASGFINTIDQKISELQRRGKRLWSK